MTRVEAKRGESPDKLLARFRRAVNRSGVLRELKERQYYEKPSERKRRKAKERLKAMRRGRSPKPQVKRDDD